MTQDQDNVTMHGEKLLFTRKIIPARRSNNSPKPPFTKTVKRSTLQQETPIKIIPRISTAETIVVH